MKKLYLGLSLIAMAVLSACGGNSGTNSDFLEKSSNSSSKQEKEYDGEVEYANDLPKCTERKDGKVYYVEDEDITYTCTYDDDLEKGEWVKKKKRTRGGDDDQESSSSVEDDEYDGIVEEFGDLPKCSEKRDGKVYYVEDEDVTYTCTYDEDEEVGEWVRKKKQPADDNDQESSSSAENVDDSSSSEELDDDSSSSEESEDEFSSSDASIYDPDENTLTDLRDGQVYRTTIIDIPSESYSEVWMAENLNYETANSYCLDDDSDNCVTYGRLYTWAVAVGKTEDECGYGHECDLGTGDIRGVCPKGWHVPSYDEWNELFTAVGGSSTAGTKLKNFTGWYSSGNGTDNYGFSALPAGHRGDNGGYDSEGDGADFWSSTEDDSSDAYRMNLGYYGDDGADLRYISKDFGFSVRCLKD